MQGPQIQSISNTKIRRPEILEDGRADSTGTVWSVEKYTQGEKWLFFGGGDALIQIIFEVHPIVFR